MHPLDDTIVAVASPPGGAARGIVRLSGPEVAACVGRVFVADGHADWAGAGSPTAFPGRLRLPGIAAPLPCDLCFWPTRRSYTGQPVAEVHTLGSPPLLEGAVEAFCAAGARPAEPGEFTLRAFLAGRIDLTQAEAVLGVIDAAGPEQLRTALAQLAGGLAAPLGSLRDRLLDLLSELEAGLDFADEDLDPIAPERLEAEIEAAAEQVARLERQMLGRGEAGELPRVVLTGRPNVGKSSLFNALLGRTGALVCDLPGTTRDYLTAELECDGVRLLLVDTAGAASQRATVHGDCPNFRAELRENGTVPLNEVHHAAQALSAEQRRRADLRLLCIDSTRPPDADERQHLAAPDPSRLLVLTKVDLPGRVGAFDEAIRTSSVTSEGIDALRRAVARGLRESRRPAGDAVASTAARCRESLRQAAAGLERALRLARTAGGDELIAAEVRTALEELGRVVGAVYTDDVLDRVFSRFCIGK